MRGTAWISALVVAVCAASVAQAQTALLVEAGQSAQLPVKGHIAARDGKVDLTFKVFDRGQGGRLIYQEVQRVDVRHGIYFAMVGTRTFRHEPRMWVEVSRGGRALGERQAFAINPHDLGVEVSPFPGSPAVLCFTCGG